MTKKRTTPSPATVPRMTPAALSAYAGLDLLPSAILLLDAECCVVHGNPAAENLVEASLKNLVGQPVQRLFSGGPEWELSLEEALAGHWSHRTQELVLTPSGRDPVPVSCVITPVDQAPARLLTEFRIIDQQIKIAREERLNEQAEANRQLMRNLAHEIKNPLGGIRGSAQLLEMELDDKDLTEYTQVIIREADRLQTLVDRLLAPHRRPHVVGDVNIHEVCERVRTLILAEFPRGLQVRRNYDISLPEFRGDMEQLIQAVLNIAHNAAQALSDRMQQGDAEIVLSTRIARQVTFVKQRYRLALELHVIDNGPGIPEEIKDRLFHPLVSGRDGGSGLGLNLAQTFVQQHQGSIECDSQPGRTDFKLLIPLP